MSSLESTRLTNDELALLFAPQEAIDDLRHGRPAEWDNIEKHRIGFQSGGGSYFYHRERDRVQGCAHIHSSDYIPQGNRSFLYNVLIPKVVTWIGPFPFQGPTMRTGFFDRQKSPLEELLDE